METVAVNISFKKSLLAEIDAAAKQEKRTRSEFLREAARAYIERQKQKRLEYHMDVPYQNTRGIRTEVGENALGYNDIHDTNGTQVPNDKKYSYADYLQWADGEKWEIIDGIPYNMAPAPSTQHQSICMALSAEFYNHFKNKPCKVFAGPLDVRLPRGGESEDEKILDVVQPDVLIVCDKSKLDAKGCLGAPELVVEIISPGTSQKDSITKLNLYEKSGVLEYWLIRPDEKTIMVFALDKDKKYGRTEVYSHKDTIKSSVFRELEINLQEVLV